MTSPSPMPLACLRARPPSPPSPVEADRETAPLGLRVISDPWVFRYITSFQEGIPVALRTFWLDHDPKPEYERVTIQIVNHLLKLIVESGAPRHLRLITSSRLFAWGDDAWRAPRIHSVARMAVETYRVDLLQWMIANDVALENPRVLWRKAVQSFEANDVAVLDMLHEVCPLDAQQAQLLLSDELRCHTAALLQWFDAHVSEITFPKTFSKAAAANRDLDALQFILSHPRSRGCHRDAFHYALEERDIEVVAFLVANCADAMSSSFKLKLMADADPHVQALVRQYCHLFESASERVFFEALRSGDKKKMLNAYATRSMINSELSSTPTSVDQAGTWTRLTGLEFLQERGIVIATTDAMDFAAEQERWDVVEFLHRTEGCTARAVDAAVRSGELKWVRLCYESLHGDCWPASMDHAAETGSLEILRFLHQHSTVRCTTKAMDAAASQGHLSIVKFLHENQSEGCSKDALDGAAKSGHRDVVEFLCGHRTEGCTATGIKAALEKHRLIIVRLLYDRYSDQFGPELLADLLLRGAFEIFMKVRDAFPEEAGSVVEPVMLEAGQHVELRTICFIMDQLGRSDLGQLAMDGANLYAGPQADQWRRAVEAITDWPRQAMSTPSSHPSLHPFLLDPRTPTWAVHMLFDPLRVDSDAFNRCTAPFTWAVRAVHHRDLSLLEVIQAVPPGTKEVLQEVSAFVHPFYQPFTFHGARAAAVRVGDKTILEWLLTNVDLPVEPTLLDEAVYYHQYEIAEWLAANYPAACAQLDWTNKGKKAKYREFGLCGNLLDWLESHDAVRSALDFTGIIDYAASKNDVASLSRLFDWYPDLFTPRPSLVELADLEECRDTINFLLEIGWSADVFLDGV